MTISKFSDGQTTKSVEEFCFAFSCRFCANPKIMYALITQSVPQILVSKILCQPCYSKWALKVSPGCITAKQIITYCPQNQQVYPLISRKLTNSREFRVRIASEDSTG